MKGEAKLLANVLTSTRQRHSTLYIPTLCFTRILRSACKFNNWAVTTKSRLMIGKVITKNKYANRVRCADQFCDEEATGHSNRWPITKDKFASRQANRILVLVATGHTNRWKRRDLTEDWAKLQKRRGGSYAGTTAMGGEDPENDSKMKTNFPLRWTKLKLFLTSHRWITVDTPERSLTATIWPFLPPICPRQGGILRVRRFDIVW